MYNLKGISRRVKTFIMIDNGIDKERINNYFNTVRILMNNDRNATFDTLLKECNNDFEYAYETLVNILDRITSEEDLSKEEKEFYINLKNNL